MKIKVNVINTSCVYIFDAVVVLNSMMMTSTLSDESLVGDTHTCRHTNRHDLVYGHFFKVSRL